MLRLLVYLPKSLGLTNFFWKGNLMGKEWSNFGGGQGYFEI